MSQFSPQLRDLGRAELERHGVNFPASRKIGEMWGFPVLKVRGLGEFYFQRNALTGRESTIPPGYPTVPNRCSSSLGGMRCKR